MTLTADQIADYQAKLDAANTALHNLLTGQQPASLGYDSEHVAYMPTNEAGLRRYIRELEAKLGQRTSSRGRSRSVVFGGCR